LFGTWLGYGRGHGATHNMHIDEGSI